MEIHKIGYHHSHESTLFIQRPEGSGDYLLLLVFTPSKLILKDKTILTKEPYFILYDEGTPQRYGANQETYLDDWMHFGMSTKERALLISQGIPLDTPVYFEDFSELSALFQWMTFEFHSIQPLSQENLSLCLRLFFNKLCERFASETIHPHYHAFSHLRSEIYNAPYQTYIIDDMAKKLQVSRSSFQHIYKELFGISMSEDLIHARIDYAKYLLTTTNFSIAQIADLCGYHSDIHFMRQFKSNTQLTPSNYRKKILG